MGWFIIGLVLAGGLLLLLNWWATAEVKSAKTAMMWGIIAICSLLALLLLAAGRNVMAILPAGYAAWRMFGAARLFSGFMGKHSSKKQHTSTYTGSMTHDEALEVLGLEKGAAKAEINAAYRKLMAQCHPDKGGSDWMAAKLTEARRTLLGK